MNPATLYFVALSVLGSAFNYLTYPLLARILPADQYMDITVALTLLTQMGTFMSALLAITIGLSKSHENGEKIVGQLQSFLLQAFIALGILFLIASPLVMSKIGSPIIYAVPITIMVILSIPITILSGFLNGRQKMIKLGLVSVVTASLQLSTGVVLAFITQDGAITMIAMGLIQIVSILILVFLFRRENLPSLRSNVFRFSRPSARIRKLLKYTLFASLAIMAVNLLQATDLLVIKNLGGPTAKLYTDTYVISRIVFFAGMIFIWPFLGSIKLRDLSSNLRSYLKLNLIFIGIAVSTILSLYIAGPAIYFLMFGCRIDMSLAMPIATLSILYKTLLLSLTAHTLYLIVMRSYRCIPVALLSCLLISIPVQFIPTQPENVFTVLSMLCVGAFISLIISLFIFRLPAQKISG